MMATKGTRHIQAFARIRPYSKQENGSTKANMNVSLKEILVNLNHGSRRFVFDRVFGSESKQHNLYQEVVVPMVNEVMQGYNCTIFAYGQTGTGKTYTMLGDNTSSNLHHTDDSRAGIIPRVFSQLFDELDQIKDVDATIRVSYLELYNEILIDLLSSEEKTLKIYDDPKSKGSVIIHGIEQVTIYDKNDVFEILQLGAQRRRTAFTLMNDASSRSHTVLMVTVHTKEMTPEGEQLVKTGKLNLVDLAGSENISRSGAVDKRAKEAGNINQSLLTLGRVIKSLVEKSVHIPYRESKLTRILQDSLGGKTMTRIIATISPAAINLEETLSTLDYACRARHIANRPVVNQTMCKTDLIRCFLEEIDTLKRDVCAARTKDGVFLHPTNYSKMLQEQADQKEELLRSVQECADFQARVAELERMHKELQDVHAVTTSDLTTSTDCLSRSKRNLRKLLKQRRIQQLLIDMYHESETTFYENTKKLNDALDQNIAERSVLQEKVNYLYNCNDSNVENASQYSGHFKADCERLKDGMTIFSENFENKSSDHRTMLQQRHDNLRNGIERFDVHARQLDNGISTILNRAQVQFEEYLQEQIDYVKSEMQLSQVVVNSLDRVVAKARDVMTGLKEALTNELEDHFSYCHSSTEEKAEKIVSQLSLQQEIARKNHMLAEASRKESIAELSNFQIALNEMQNKVKSLTTALDRTSKTAEEQSKLLEDTTISAISNFKENATTELQTHKDKLHRIGVTMDTLCSGISDVESISTEAIQSIKTNNNSRQERIDKIKEHGQKVAQQFKSDTHLMNKLVEDTKAEVCADLTNVDSTLLDALQNIDELRANVDDFEFKNSRNLELLMDNGDKFFNRMQVAKKHGNTPLVSRTFVKPKTPQRVNVRNLMETSAFNDSISCDESSLFSEGEEGSSQI